MLLHSLVTCSVSFGQNENRSVAFRALAQSRDLLVSLGQSGKPSNSDGKCITEYMATGNSCVPLAWRQSLLR